MASQKKSVKPNQLRKQLATELQFIRNIFASISMPIHTKDDDINNDFELTNGVQPGNKKELSNRASSISELEQKLHKLKSQNNYNLKSKLSKKSINSKLNKKLKKKERVNKTKINETDNYHSDLKQQTDVKPKVNLAKPIFNNEGKLVFSKFDFANFGKKEKSSKVHKDPKKILDDMKQQENKFRLLQETDNSDKVKVMKEKLAWKNTLQKAEGQKVKDDPILLKKSIKRMEQKKKSSKKNWENRIKNVEQKKEERQKKRKDNISKKKKEKKTKVVKAAMKRGRVVI